MEILSVDLGTSNTVAVLSAHGRPPTVLPLDGAPAMPSAVFAPEAGELVVGREAVRRARADPARFEPTPKRRIDEGTLLLGSRVVPVTDALAAVLRRIVVEVSRQLGGRVPERIRVTHPAQWGPVRRNTLLSAARQAGMGNATLVPEPIAAAAHFASFPGRGLAPGQALAVYDLGAGTFDVGIVGVGRQGFVVLAEAGLPDLGGLDVDQALLDHIGRQVASRDPAAWQRLGNPEQTADRRAARTLREDVTSAKEALSAHPQTEVALPAPFEDVLVTRAELESLIRPNLVRSVELLAATIRMAGLAPDRLAGIYLVGGSSRIPLVAQLITHHLQVVPTSLDLPESTVALGAHQVPEVAHAPQTAQVSQPLPVGAPRTGGFPAPPPVSPPPARPVQPSWSPPPRLAQPLPRKRKRALPWVAAAVGLALVATAAIFMVRGGFGGNDGPSVADCTGQPSPDKVANCVQALSAPFGATHTCGGNPGKWVCNPKNPATDPRLTFSSYASAADTAHFIALDLVCTNQPLPVPWASGGLGGKYWLCRSGYSSAEVTDESSGFVLIASIDQPNMSVKIEFDLNMQLNLDAASRKRLVTDFFLNKVAPKS